MRTGIVADVLIPGRGEPIEHGTVAMEHGEITFAGASVDAPASSSDDDVVEAPVVMPGLWDCHTRFVGVELSSLDVLATTDVVVAAARAVEDASRCCT